MGMALAERATCLAAGNALARSISVRSVTASTEPAILRARETSAWFSKPRSSA